MGEAVVVGSGPNGLAAAVTLASHGIHVTVLEAGEVGGGARSGELTVPGLVHDHCSAVHPLGRGSPFLSSLGLERHGLRWCWPEIDLAHPLDAGDAGVLRRDIVTTVDGLGRDGPAWRRLFAPLADGFDNLAADLLGPLTRAPQHPLGMARFGLHAMRPATTLARRWRTPAARGLFAGVAAHGFHRLDQPFGSAVGLLLVAAGHRHGWPVAAGGSGAITAALVARLEELGGTIETGVRVRTLKELQPARVVLLDVAPGVAADICGERLPRRVRRSYRRWRHGPAAFKVDLAVHGGVPWTNEDCRRAGTLHLGGTLEEIAAAEATVAAGRMPERPFVLAAQQYLADTGRSAGDLHPVYAYAHVPHGYQGDATEAVIRQIERFAPGVRDRIAHVASRSCADLERENPNLVGGDIVGGESVPVQILARPRPTRDPYATGLPGVYLCSAATPPGAGVHGMCGHLAAVRALRYLDTAPSTRQDQFRSP